MLSKKDGWTLIGFIITTVITATSVAFSYFAWKENEYLSSTKKPNLAVAIARSKDDERIEFRDRTGKYSLPAITSSWDVRVSNISDLAVAVVDYKVSEFLFIEWGEQLGKLPYSFPDMVDGLTDPKSGNSALPVTLAPGETKVFRLSVRVEISSFAREKLAYELRFKPDTTIHSAEEALLQFGTDLFGNKVSVSNGKKTIEYTTYHPNKAHVQITFITANGVSFAAEGVWHPELQPK